MDDDLIAYLEKKIKTLEEERDHWKANHDNQVRLKNEVAETRFVAMRKQIDDLLLENKRLRLSLGNEDPRGDGDLLPESERLDKLTRECMRDELAASANDSEDAMRRRLMEPFLGSEAEKLGATKYQLRNGEEWLSTCEAPLWLDDSQYILVKGE